MGDELLGDLDTAAGVPRTNNWLFDPHGVSIILIDVYRGWLANCF